MTEHAALDSRFRLVPDARFAAEEELSELLRDDDFRIWIVEDANNHATGYLLAHLHWGHPFFEPREVIFIRDVFIHTSFRGQGMGRALLEQVHVWAQKRGISQIELWVLAQNTTALAFWEAVQAKPFSVFYTLEVKNA